MSNFGQLGDHRGPHCNTGKVEMIDIQATHAVGHCLLAKLLSLKLTGIGPRDDSNRNLLFQGSIFRGYVSFREGNTPPCKLTTGDCDCVEII